MANVAVPAPVSNLTIGGITAAAGLITPSNGSSFTTTNLSLTFAGNNGLMLLNFVIAATGVVAGLQFNCPNSANNPAAITLANSGTYWLGPFDPAIYNWPTGSPTQSSIAVANLIYVTMTSVGAANTVQAFYMNATRPPAGYLSAHNPFSGGLTVGAEDQ